MDRLRNELERLYGLQAALPPGRVRAAMLELVQPAGWAELARVWQGVQADADCPAPAIAVNGRDGYQLWFSFAQAVEAAQASAFLAALCRRYLAEVRPGCVRSHPGCEDGGAIRPLPPAPPVQVDTQRWSAFLAPDLAPVFADEPWLDHPPGAEAQAEILARLQPIGEEALGRLLAHEAAAASATHAQPAAAPAGPADPRSFLVSVMQDPTVALRWRIEAAKALLQAGHGA